MGEHPPPSILLAALLFVAVCAAAPTAWAKPPDPLARIEAAVPACPKASEHCFGLRLHVVFKGNEPVQTPAWIAAQIGEANTRFEGTGIGFELASAQRLPMGMEKIRNRAQRDRLGRGRIRSGVIDVFLVGQLDNVDAKGEINGVHWRNRGDRRQRWIILSKIAWHVVLAHELGHFFGLPHSEYPASIMNKKHGDDRPPLEEWGFHDDEVAIIGVRRRKMVKAGFLKLRQVGP